MAIALDTRIGMSKRLLAPSARAMPGAYQSRNDMRQRTPTEYICLYAAYCRGYAKIGLATNLKSRISQMQTGCPFAIAVIATSDIPRRLAAQAEDAALLALDASHHFGDWFKCSRADARLVVEQASSKFGGKPWAPKRNTTPGTTGNSRAILTPRGEFRGAVEAAAAFGIARAGANRRARLHLEGWAYAP